MVAKVFGPTLLALVLGIVGVSVWQWRIPSVTEAIAGVSITSGLLFGLLVFAFQLRLQVAHDPRSQQRLSVPRLIDQLFGTIVVATVTGGILVALLLIAASTVSSGLFGWTPSLHWGWTLILLPGGTLYFTLLLVVVARVYSAYRAAVTGREVGSSTS